MARCQARTCASHFSAQLPSSDAASDSTRDFASRTSSLTPLPSKALAMNAAIATPNAALASRVGGIAAKTSVKQLRRASGLPTVAPLRTRNVVKAAASSEVRSEAHARYRRDRDRGLRAVASTANARRRLVVFAHPTVVSRIDAAARAGKATRVSTFRRLSRSLTFAPLSSLPRHFIHRTHDDRRTSL